jgi:hypothetical protein
MPSNGAHEFLFKVASEYLQLDARQKLSVGLRLGLVNVGAALYAPHYLDEVLFSEACKQSKISQLVSEIERIRNASSQ